MSQVGTYPVLETFDPGILFVLIQIDPYWWYSQTATARPGGGATELNGDIWTASPAGYKNNGTGNSSTADYQYAVFWGHGDQPIVEVAGMNYAQDEVQGRVEPFVTGISGSPHTFSLTLQAVAQYPTGASAVDSQMPQDDLDPVYQARWFQQLSQPLYDANNDQNIEPPPVLVQIGNLLVARCIVTHCDIQWMSPYQPWTMQPAQAVINLSFMVQRIPHGLQDYSGFYTVNPNNLGAVGIGGVNVHQNPGFQQYDVPLWNRFVEFPKVTA